MRVCEKVIMRYCDFCSEARRERATASCGLCSADLCDGHKNLIPVLKAMPKQTSGQLFQGPMQMFLRYKFVAVCPDCSFQSFFSLMESLSKKPDSVEVPKQ